MTLTRMKTLVHKEVEKIDDLEKLEALKIFIATNILNSGEPKLNGQRLASLKKSRQQAENGQRLKNEDVDNEIEKWLNE